MCVCGRKESVEWSNGRLAKYGAGDGYVCGWE